MIMRQELNQLTQSLRNELMAYAEISIRLNRHFQFLAHPLDGDIGETANKVQIKGRAIQRARKERTRAHVTVARVLQLEADVPIEKIIPSLPADDRSLVIALVRAGRELRAQVLLTLRRNQVLLRHAEARVRHFLNNLFPGHFEKINPADAPKTISIPVADTAPPVIFDVEIVISKPNPFRFVASRHVHGFHFTGFLSVTPHAFRVRNKNGTQITN